jgi:hypothetical protein
MDVLTALQTEGKRLTYENRWLVYDNANGWCVYEHEYHAKHATLLVSSIHIEKALAYLMGK